MSLVPKEKIGAERNYLLLSAGVKVKRMLRRGAKAESPSERNGNDDASGHMTQAAALECISHSAV